MRQMKRTSNNFLTEKDINFRELKCVSHVQAKSKSFRLDVNRDVYQTLLDENFWPEGVKVRAYIPPRQQNMNNGSGE